MSKNQKASGITNIINYDNSGNISFVSGSTTLMSVSSSGAVLLTGTMSGGVATSASLSANSNLLQGTGSVGFATTASLLAVSSSQQQISASLLTLTASYTALSSSYTALSGSYTTFSGSASTRVTQIENTYATTGSNSFRANQSITGSLVVSSTITAQTLVVQTVTSSIAYSSGSNIFGSALGDRQTFTGSIYQTGSIAAFAGSVGIGTTNPKTYSSLTSTGQIIALNNIGVDYGQSFRLNNYYNSGTTTDRTISTGYAASIGLDQTNGGFTFNISSGSASADSNITTTERLRISSSGNVGIGTTNLGPDGLSLPANFNYTWSEGSGNAYATLFRQLNSAATVVASGYKRSSTGAFASSYGISMARAAIAVGYNNGSIAFFSDAASNVANGTDITITEKVTITSAGNVGIGTATPAYTLDVSGSGRFTSTVSSTTSTTGATIKLGGFTNYGTIQDVNDVRRIWFENVGSYRTIFDLPTSGTAFAFRTNDGTSLFNIASSGASTFSGSVIAGGDITIPNGNYYYAKRNTGGSTINIMGFTSGTDTLVIKGGTSGGAVAMQFQDTAGPVMSLYNGKVGIGVTNPSQKLAIQADSGGYGLIEFKNSSGTTNAYTGIPDAAGNVFTTSAAGDLCLRSDTTGTIVFGYSNSEKMRINSSGNLGIGITSPSQKLHVEGGELLTYANSSWYRRTFERNVSSWDTFISFTPQSSPQYTYGFINITACGYVNGTSAGGVTTSRWYYSITNNAISVSVVGTDITAGSQAPSIRLTVSSNVINVQAQSATPASTCYTTMFVDAMLGSGYINGTSWVIS